MKRFVYPMCVLVAIACVSMFMVAGCGDDDDDSAPTTSTLTVSPSSVSFTSGIITNIQFIASNGRSPYTWTVNNASLGVVVGAGSTAIYTSTTNSGRNFVTVTDAATNTASATINQN